MPQIDEPIKGVEDENETGPREDQRNSCYHLPANLPVSVSSTDTKAAVEPHRQEVTYRPTVPHQWPSVAPINDWQNTVRPFPSQPSATQKEKPKRQTKQKPAKGSKLAKSKRNASDNEVKALCPNVAPGYWEARASDKGFSIHLRWRNENKILDDFMFDYLGKRELASIQKGTVNEQRNDIYDRLVGQLIREGRQDLAARIEKPSQDDQGSVRADRAAA